MKLLEWLSWRVWPWSEIRRLRGWKAQYLAVESTWDSQAVGRELDMPWGVNILPRILPGIQQLKKALAEKESAHERLWLLEAAMYADVDFGFVEQQVENGQRAFNGELQCAKECYRRGMGSREFPEFLRRYRGTTR